MTLRFLLDTSIVSEPAAPTPNREVLRRLEQFTFASAIAAPVWHELNYGMRRLSDGKRRTRLEVYLTEIAEAFPVLAYDENAAEWHAHERARLEALGTPAPYLDGQIAAIAFTNDLALVTANPRDFARYEGLTIQDWTKRRRRG